MSRKLTRNDVIEILNDDTSTITELATRYNVHIDTINKIYRRENWVHLYDEYGCKRSGPKTKRKLTLEVVRSIKNLEPVNFEELAKKFNTTVKYLKGLRNPKRIHGWKYVPVKGYEDFSNIPPTTPKKLNADMAIAIYCDRASSKKEISKKYNIQPATVREIQIGKRWRSVTSKIQLDC